jgi:hypothetical protein
MKKNAEIARQQPPKVDWKEFVQIDKLYPLLTRNEQMQILQKVEIQPDMQGKVAGLPQARDILTAKTKMAEQQNNNQGAMQELAIAREKHAMDMQGKKVDQRAKLVDVLTKAYQAEKGKNDRAGDNQPRQ